MGNTEKPVSQVRKDEMGENKNNRPVNEVTVIEFGPLKITGKIDFKNLQTGGTETSEKELWLCRCGKSSNKPFCDESHKRK